jgi:hypothetical protein
VKLATAGDHVTVVTMRASLPRWALLFDLIGCALIGCALAGCALGGCATAPAAAPDRYSPAEMQHGPSLYETGHIAVVPPSNAGLRIDEGTIDRRTPAPLPVHATKRAHRNRKSRARAQRSP